MSTQSSIQQGVANLSIIIGKGLIYGGGAGLLAMAVIGTISVDLVLLAYASKRQNDFMTGWILGTMFWGPRINPLPLLLISPITSLIAAGLSVALGVPYVGIAIMAGWALASTVLLIGCALVAAGEALDTSNQENNNIPYNFSPNFN